MTPEEIQELKEQVSALHLVEHLSNFIVFPVPNIDFFTMEGLPDFEPLAQQLDFLTNTTDGLTLTKQIQNVLNEKTVEYLLVLLNYGLFYIDNKDEAEILLTNIENALSNLQEKENGVIQEYVNRLNNGQENVNYGPEVDLYDDGTFVEIVNIFKG